MKNNTYLEMKKARTALVSVAVGLFDDRLTYDDNVKAFEDRMVELLKEYDKIIDDYMNSDIDLIKIDEEW